MWHEDMLWGHVLRSTAAHAGIVSIDTGEALATPGVYAVLTYDDLPTEVKNYGLEIQDTPVLAHGKVRHHGEPVAIEDGGVLDRKSTRLNSSHAKTSYAVFCLTCTTVTQAPRPE